MSVRNFPVPLRRTLGARYLAPRRKGLCTKQLIMNRTQQMLPKTKQIVNGAMHEEKMLGVARRFESAHLAFPLARRLMRHFIREGKDKWPLRATEE